MRHWILAVVLALSAPAAWAATPTAASPAPAIGDIPPQALGKDGKGQAITWPTIGAKWSSSPSGPRGAGSA